MVVVLELNQLLMKHRPSLVKRARYLLGDSEIAEDVVQEALVYVASRSSEFATPDELEAALYWKVRYLAIDHSRRKATLPQEVELNWLAENSATMVDDYNLGGDEGKEIVALALAKLSDAQRTALVLTAVEEISQQQAARQLEISHDAVRQLLRRARANFRANLETELRNRGWRRSDLLKFLATPSLLLALLIPFAIAPNTSDSNLLNQLSVSLKDELGYPGTGSAPAETRVGGETEVDKNDSIIFPGSPSLSKDSMNLQLASSLDSDLQPKDAIVPSIPSDDDSEVEQLDSFEDVFLQTMAVQDLEQSLATRLPSLYLTFTQAQLNGFWKSSSQLEVSIGESLVLIIELDMERPDGRIEVIHAWGTLDLEEAKVAFAGATSAQQWSSSLGQSASNEASAEGWLHFVARDLVFGDVSSSVSGAAIDGIEIGKDIIQVRLETDSGGQIKSLEIQLS